MTWRLRALRCRGRLGALAAVAALALGGCSSPSAAVSSTRQQQPTGLTHEQIALATHIARNEIAKQGSHIRIAVAQLHPGTVRQSNTGHTCDSGTLLRVTMIGSFPHTTVAPTPGGEATVHAEVVEANPSTGQECLIAVKIGEVHLPDGATRLQVSTARSGTAEATPSATTTPAPAATPSRTGTGLVAPDLPNPVAGICGGNRGGIVTLYVEPDTPAPRCTIVRPDQRVRVINRTSDFGQVGKTTVIRWADFTPVTLHVGQSVTYPGPVRKYLEPGVRAAAASFYGNAASFEIRLRQ